MKENLIRLGCVLLGVLLTVSTLQVWELIKGRPDSEMTIVTEIPVTESGEELVMTEDVKLYSDYDDFLRGK